MATTNLRNLSLMKADIKDGLCVILLYITFNYLVIVCHLCRAVKAIDLSKESHLLDDAPVI